MLKKLFYGSAAILMLAVAYHLGAQTARASTTMLAAQSFVLEDAQGQIKARLSADQNGIPSLTMFSATGKSLYLGFAAEGSPMLTYRSASDSLTMMLCSHERGTDLLLSDLNGTARVTLTAGPGVVTGLKLMDDNGNLRTALGGSHIGASSLVLTDEKGDIVFQAPPRH